MAIRARIQTRGGHKVRRIVRDANRRRRQPRIKVGFFETAKYDDGTLVSAVAATHEYGKDEQGQPIVPERPFFRQSLAIIERTLSEELQEHINPETMQITQQLAGQIGQYAVGVIQERITDLKDPPNAPSTIAAKGSDNPLIDTGHMRQSVTYVVEN